MLYIIQYAVYIIYTHVVHPSNYETQTWFTKGKARGHRTPQRTPIVLWPGALVGLFRFVPGDLPVLPGDIMESAGAGLVKPGSSEMLKSPASDSRSPVTEPEPTD